MTAKEGKNHEAYGPVPRALHSRCALVLRRKTGRARAAFAPDGGTGGACLRENLRSSISQSPGIKFIPVRYDLF